MAYNASDNLFTYLTTKGSTSETPDKDMILLSARLQTVLATWRYDDFFSLNQGQ